MQLCYLAQSIGCQHALAPMMVIHLCLLSARTCTFFEDLLQGSVARQIPLSLAVKAFQLSMHTHFGILLFRLVLHSGKFIVLCSVFVRKHCRASSPRVYW